MFNRKIWLLFIYMLFVVSCSTGPQYQDLSGNVTYQTLVFPPAVYGSLVWFKDHKLIAFLDYDVDKSGVATRYDYDLSHNPYAMEGDLEIHDFQFKSVDDCSLITDYYPMSLLPDGRLGMLKGCGRALPEKTLYLAAYDWDAQSFEKTLNYPLPNPMRSRCFSWNPQMTRAIQGTYDGTTGSLYWLTPQGPEPLQLVLKDGDKVWDISKSYAGNGNSSEGIAGCPLWAPDGEHIFFMASLDAIGVSGFDRSRTNFDLYSYSVSTGQAERLLHNVFSPYNLRLSPDGEKIAFMTNNENQDTSSLWVFRLEDKKLFRLLASDNLQDMVWSPDSKDIAVLWCGQIGCTSSEIRKYSFGLP
jgi:hypothetical protein